MAAPVVDLLEPVDVADEQREPPSVAIGAGCLELELAHEAAPVPQPRERVVVGQELHLLELRGGVQRGRRLVGEHAQGLQAGRRRHQQVDRVIRPDQSDQLTAAPVQRHDQPVVVPGVRALTAALRAVRVGLGPHACAGLFTGQQIAALRLELRHQQHRDLRQREAAVDGRVVELPPVGGARLEVAGVGVGQVDRDRLEPQRVVDAVADRLQDRVDRERLGQPRGHPQQLLERVSVPRRLGRLLSALDRQRGVRRQRHQHVQLLVGRLAAGHRLVDRHDPQQRPVRVVQRHHQRILRVPGVLRGVARQLGDV